MNYIKKLIVFAIAYCIITPYNFLYGTEINNRNLGIIEVNNDSNGITTIVEKNLKYENDEEKFLFLQKTLSFFPPKDQVTNQNSQSHNLDKVSQLYSPLFQFIEEKTFIARRDILVNAGVYPSILKSYFISSYIKKAIKPEISLKDPELGKIITKISKDGFNDPVVLHRFLLLTSLDNFSIKGIEEHTIALVHRIINSPLEYKHIPSENMPAYIDVNNPENNVKNQFALLFANTDFDCNSMIHDDWLDEYSFEMSYTIFAELFMTLSQNKNIDSLPIVEQWLDKGADSNGMCTIKLINDSKIYTYTARNPFKVALDLLLEGEIQCTDPKKMITVFLAKKADPNIECLDIKRENGELKFYLETPFEAFIKALNKEKFLLEEKDRNELIDLFIKSRANTKALNQANFFN